ncbi:MAG: hypothetical protein VB108_05925 [Anaerolineaceae bacterium]|nr:hypothetical protein [Anaerolineaceae bacterium]
MQYMILSALSGICWSFVYVAIILKNYQDKTCGMPLFALTFNVAWELIFGVFTPGSISIQKGVNIIWSLLDLVIVFQYFKYAKKEFPKQYSKHFTLWSITAFISAFAIIIAFSREFSGFKGAQYAAYLQNLAMSILFIDMLLRRNSVHGQSMLIAVFKMVGTLCPTLMVIFSKGSHLLITLGAVIFVFDLIYLLLLNDFLHTKKLNKELFA